VNQLRKLLRQNIRDYAMYIALAIVIGIFTVLTHGIFLSSRNISNLLNQTGYLAVLAIGMTLVFIIRYFDMSVGYLSGFLGAIAANDKGLRLYWGSSRIRRLSMTKPCWASSVRSSGKSDVMVTLSVGAPICIGKSTVSLSPTCTTILSRLIGLNPCFATVKWYRPGCNAGTA